MRPGDDKKLKRILVVDDDALTLQVIARALEGYEVTVARDGDEALRLAAPGSRIDLLITDYLMPTMMGDELLGLIRERRPSLKTLVITGHSEILERELQEWWAGQPHLTKPFTIAALRDTVTRLIGPAV
jgi:CheY-like chemotaxis protein